MTLPAELINNIIMLNAVSNGPTNIMKEWHNDWISDNSHEFFNEWYFNQFHIGQQFCHVCKGYYDYDNDTHDLYCECYDWCYDCLITEYNCSTNLGPLNIYVDHLFDNGIIDELQKDEILDSELNDKKTRCPDCMNDWIYKNLNIDIGDNFE
jgi:hypothetical protein